MFDLSTATGEMTRVVSGVRDDQLGGSTPCADWTVAGLLAHIHQFTVVFTQNARKEPVRPPHRLVDDWRSAIPAQLDELARAWREDGAWQGRVSAGGIERPAADNAVVAVEELTVHGWDLAAATGQRLDPSDDQLDRVEPFFALFGQDLPPGEGP
ncbi:MAG: TIGR03086 family metal-binding protein, partial [Phycicoccus sp.]